MLRLSFAIVFLFASTATADHILLIKQGKYFTVDFDTKTVHEITQVFNVDGSKPNDPTKPVDPVNPAKTTRDKLRDISIGLNDPLIEKAIAEGIYATLHAKLKDGTMTWQQCLEAIKKATDGAVSFSGNKAAWETWRSDLNKIVDDLQREGKLATKEQQISFLSDVEFTLNSTSANAAIDFAKLIQIIRFIIDLINAFGIRAADQPPVGVSPIQKSSGVVPGPFEHFMLTLREQGKQQ